MKEKTNKRRGYSNFISWVFI